jgi:TP901 family phage tail tape measure protein
MNGFQLQATDMGSVLDRLVALDNAYATSVAEIADAMQRSSNSAKQSGVSLTELASYITILSSTTRKSAESIGESLKL